MDQDAKNATHGTADEASSGYEAPRVESVLTPDDMEREALFGGGISIK